jgi:hypothetical protein
MAVWESYKENSTEELIKLYEQAASEHGQAQVRHDYHAGNPAADRIAAIYRELRKRGRDHQQMLLALLTSSDPGVRLWAASHALEFEPSQGEAVLGDFLTTEGILAFDARVTLDEWRKGTLRFP